MKYLLLLLVGLLAGNVHAMDENLAAGRRCELSPVPNYHHCTDPADPMQLTDGRTTTDYFWTQQGTVGWTRAPFATVTVDLGELQLIGGASLTTAAGRAGVTWPMAVPVLVSDDKETWREAGDLVALDHAERGPWPEEYAIRRIHTDRLKARGRYVRLVLIPVPGGPYTFTDEIEVFRGESEPIPGPVTTAKRCFEEGRIRRAVHHRWNEDHRALAHRLAGDESAGDLQAARQVLHGKGPGTITTDDSLQAILPLTPNHATLFAIQANLWIQQGAPPLTAWSVNPWDPMNLFFTPPQENESQVRLDAMRGETRAGAVNLANATGEAMDVRCRLRGLPDTVTLQAVEWTDTSKLTPVAAALRDIPREGREWTVRVLPGLVRQVWISANTHDVPAGVHQGALEFLAPDAEPLTIPVRLRVRPLDMPRKKTMWLGGWSYTDGDGRYGMTPENRNAFQKHLQEHGVNAPWATSAVLNSFRFDADRIELDTTRLDDWVARWPEADHYLVFLSVAHYGGAIKTSFGGAALGSDEFNRKVGAWITAWVKHLESKGISPNRLGLLIHDEPHEGSDLGPFLAWARAIKAAQPQVLIWEDPTYRNPAAASAELFDACDILCPNRPMWLSHDESFAAHYRAQQKRGKMLQLYSCSGPVKLLDPYSYYRLQAWHAWDIGATGSFFWAFGDNGGASSWNEYLARSGPYTPMFVDAGGVTAGKHMEAIRESGQDYETLVMLQNAIIDARQAGGHDEGLAQAEQLLESAVKSVLRPEDDSDLLWNTRRDRGAADAARAELLDTLERLRSTGPTTDP